MRILNRLATANKIPTTTTTPTCHQNNFIHLQNTKKWMLHDCCQMRNKLWMLQWQKNKKNKQTVDSFCLRGASVCNKIQQDTAGLCHHYFGGLGSSVIIMHKKSCGLLLKMNITCQIKQAVLILRSSTLTCHNCRQYLLMITFITNH